MKSIKILTVMAMVVLLASCAKDDDLNEVVLSENEIPTQILDYKTKHFANNAIIRAIKDKEWTTTTYELYLEGGFELDFNANFQITDIDGTSKLPDSLIPQALLDYVAQNYTTNFITDWELELKHQQIELNNGMELEFKMNGAFIRIDND